MGMLHFLPTDREHPSRTAVTCALHDFCNAPANKVATALGVIGSRGSALIQQ